MIDAYEDKLAQQTTALHLNRLQASIDVINAAQMPTDVDTLLASIRIRTATRGSFCAKQPSLDSLHKWFAHLSGDPIKTPRNLPTRQIFEQWAHVARVATKLQLQVNNAAANNGQVGTWEEFSREFARQPSPMNDGGLYQLYTRILDSGGLHGPAIGGPWHHGKREGKTFPGASHFRYRLTPLRTKMSSDPTRLISPLAPPHVVHDPLGLDDPLNLFSSLLPAHQAGIDLAPLGLPALPLHDTFCYYVTSKKVLKTLFEARAMTLWVRAAVLERVELF